MAKQKQEQILGMDATPEQQEKLVHLGKMMGQPTDDFDEELSRHLDALYPHERSYEKMRAAESGGSSLGPSDIEQEQAQQSQGQARAQATQQAATASQAQAAQSPVNAPPAPAGPAGVSTPFEAQKGLESAPRAQDVEPEVPGMQSPASQVQPPPAPDQQSQ